MADYLTFAIRFNWPHPSWQGKDQLTYQKWLRQRLDLFTKYTSQSLHNLYDKPNSIILLVDSRTWELETKRQLLAALGGIGCDILFGDAAEGRSLTRTIEKQVHEHAKQSIFSRIITIRLDSDDLVGSFYIAAIRAAAKDIQSETCVLSFPGGCNFVPNENVFFFSSYPCNPFLGYLEPFSISGLKSVFKKMHIDMIDGSESSYLIRQNRPAWASVIHGGNLANTSLLTDNKYTIGPTLDLLRLFGISSHVSH
jgi:hypothetical protein